MRAKGFISDDEDEDGNIKLKVGYINAASKALAQLWLERAREYRKTTIIKEREDMKLDIRRVLEHLSEEHDWYYGQDLRLTGKALKDEGDELQETRRQFEGDAKAAARELEDDLKTFTLEKEAQAQAEIEEIEEKMRQDRVKLLEKGEMRIQEITRNKTRMKAQFEKEVKLAPPEDRAGMVAVHKEEVKKLDALIDEERKKQAEAIERRIDAGKNDLGARQRKREDALSVSFYCIL
jgi:DNA-directed RNA polymerase